jgi:hypothetical protein
MIFAVIYAPDPEIYDRLMCSTWVCNNPQILFGIVLIGASTGCFFFTWLWRTLVRTRSHNLKKEIGTRQKDLNKKGALQKQHAMMDIVEPNDPISGGDYSSVINKSVM